MNPAETIHRRLFADPYEPFRVVTATGKTFDFPYPRSGFVTTTRLYVGLDFEDEIPGTFTICPVADVLRVEPLPAHSERN